MLRKHTEDSVGVSGHVTVYTFPLTEASTFEQFKALSERRKRQLIHDDGSNIVVSVGLDHIVKLLVGTSTDSITHGSVGSSTTGNSAGMTDLTTPISPRLVITNRYPESTGKAHYEIFYGGSDNAGTWNEVGLHTAITSGTMLARKIITTFTKINTPDTGANAALVSWLVTFTATGT